MLFKDDKISRVELETKHMTFEILSTVLELFDYMLTLNVMSVHLTFVQLSFLTLWSYKGSSSSTRAGT